ncbi:adenylosuccinate synthase [Blattabacterium punctulatus]|uniref:Adenylosuccinate synthetase n=1 Tax=Blattabacterium punctulatus TaxID=164514 RepID=A0ABN5M3K1_9FLAO|nr:adenylosuccinate synthase [Blattabacterium punctulatus]AWU39983.1 adenylosuccinate synthase [Blattabacterium punctulatus]AWU40526.1 adenylosuccinate synthase [Blattabacterium punctulatus]AWU42775.1 adenylosuccinate synthase [Blattabacterium punctulatus]AWU44981.1 adenylosuccinate synthase [Blattabacterium punctulatus]AWU46059.1 adenylosuccinate synthase [Blattabacterium punctulatus]
MPSNVIVGLQWGDEGKGKITDLLSKNSDYVIRYQGGNNSGHSIHINNRNFILHLIPSGVVNPSIKCIIAPGMVIDPKSLIQEIKEIESIGINTSRVFLAKRAHLTMPYHRLLDEYKEEALGSRSIGTTHRGIGPTYEDKIARIGIRLLDFLNLKVFHKKLKDNVDYKNKIITKVYKKNPIYFKSIYEEYIEYAKILSPRIIDSVHEIHYAFHKKKKILFEGAQAMLLDINYGTYPYVTPSSPSTGGVCTGTGIPPNFLKNFIGIAKAYCTRVGYGPFPTEIRNKMSDIIRKKGNEYGSTTKRSRRCGWLDLLSLKYSCMINGINYLIITKLDVLSELELIKVCVKYKSNGKKIQYFPSNIELEEKKVEAIYIDFPGWKKDISHIHEYDDLPKNCKKYVNFIESYLNLDIVLISVGSERNQNIIKNKSSFLKIFS